MSLFKKPPRPIISGYDTITGPMTDEERDTRHYKRLGKYLNEKAAPNDAYSDAEYLRKELRKAREEIKELAAAKEEAKRLIEAIRKDNKCTNEHDMHCGCGATALLEALAEYDGKQVADYY
ncbi:hypothetical protein C4571_02035 [Candidatus Parcubacteria bacterium]|nr:MAG: hypothetical protein C4571_02035 [Candidatus Parcubacteria bacterium]